MYEVFPVLKGPFFTVLFQESAKQEPILFGKVSMDNTSGMERDDNFDRPRYKL